MRGVRVAIIQFHDPVSGQDAMTPFLAVFEDDPEWKHVIAQAHGVIASRMNAIELISDRACDGVIDYGGPVRMQVLRSGGWKVPLESLVDYYMQFIGKAG